MPIVFSARAKTGRQATRFAVSSLEPLAITAEIAAKPKNGRANAELLSGLKKVLGCNVSLMAGHRSRNKRLSADCTKDELVKRITEHETEKR